MLTLVLDAEDPARVRTAERIIDSNAADASTHFVYYILSTLYKQVNPAALQRIDMLIAKQGSVSARLGLVPRVARKYNISLVRTFRGSKALQFLVDYFTEPLP